MNSLPTFLSGKAPVARRRRGGFTLVELLVAIAILAIIIILFGQMVGMMNKVWIYGHGRANNFTKARAMLELISQDIQSGIFRPDLAAFPTSGTGSTPPTWGFYTARPGIPVSGTAALLRNVSVVQYTFIGPTNPNNGIPNTVERADSPILWSDPATNLLFMQPTAFSSALTITPRDTASGVIAFQVVFIQADGSFSYTFNPVVTGMLPSSYNPTRAVSITLAVIDDVTVPKLTSGQLTTLNGLLTTTAMLSDNPPKRSIKSYWDTYLNGGSMNWNAYPKALGSGLATFERYVPLPNAP